MDKEVLERYLLANFSTREIAEKCGKGQSTVRYWLNKHDLKCVGTKQLVVESTRVCKECFVQKPIEDFYLKDKIRSKARDLRCKTCANKSTTDRFKLIKQTCVDYKGGCCSSCGYSKCLAALDFHHLDPRQKDFTISSVKNTQLTEDIYKELDKCVLLCANCHREVHAN